MIRRAHVLRAALASAAASLAVVLLCAGGAMAEEAGRVGVDPARIAAAKKLMEVTGVTRQMDGMVTAMGEGFRKGANDARKGTDADKLSDAFDRQMKRLMSYRDAMIDDFAVIYAQRFTAEELEAVTDFYQSPTGQKFIEAMPALMQAGAQIGMKYSQKVLEGTKE